MRQILIVCCVRGLLQTAPTHAGAAARHAPQCDSRTSAAAIGQSRRLADVIDSLGSPAALTLAKIAGRAQGDFAEWLRDRKNARRIPHRLEACGYVAVRNEAAKDRLWKIDGRRQVIYAKAQLSLRDRMRAAQDIAGT